MGAMKKLFYESGKDADAETEKTIKAGIKSKLKKLYGRIKQEILLAAEYDRRRMKRIDDCFRKFYDRIKIP